MVRICGRLRILTRRHSWSALSSTLTLSLPAERVSPPYPRSLLTRPTAKEVVPCPATSLLCASDRAELLFPKGSPIKLKPGFVVAERTCSCVTVTIPEAVLTTSVFVIVSISLNRPRFEQERILQAQFHAEFIGVVEPYFRDEDLDGDLRRILVQLLDYLHDLVEIPRRRANDQRVVNSFRNDDHLAFDLPERAFPRRGRRVRWSVRF